MVRDEHTPFIENIPAYAIGAMDADEAAALESHLATCASCRTELAEYRLVSESLLTAVPPKPPSAALRKRLQSRLPRAKKASRPQWTWSFGSLAMGLTVVALLVLNLLSLTQFRRIQNQQADLLNQLEDAQAALALLSSQTAQMFSVSGEKVSGTLLLDEEQNRAVLIVQDLPMLAQDQTYQAWLIEPDGGRVSAGLFHAESGQTYTTQVIFASQELSDFVGIGVTIEPSGGSEAPTGERIFKVDF
ncbi:MAG: anti-sigma factor [Chloroflexota bacterium]